MEYIFNYKIEGKTTLSARFGIIGDVIAYIVPSLVTILCFVFTFLALIEDKNFMYIALVMFLFALIFGPYQIFIKRFYNLALKQDGTVIVKSIVNFIPRSYIFHAKDIAHIQVADILMFYDKQKRVIGNFNCLVLLEKQILEGIELIKKFNPDLVVDLS